MDLLNPVTKQIKRYLLIWLKQSTSWNGAMVFVMNPAEQVLVKKLYLNQP